MRPWKRKATVGPTHVVPKSLRVSEKRLYLTDVFLDSFPTDEEILAHFTEDFRFIIEAKVIRQTEWMAGEVPADDFRAMVIVRGVLRDTQPSTDT